MAANVKYHDSCLTSFLKPTSKHDVGEPLDEKVTEAMEEIFYHIEYHEDSQFTIGCLLYTSRCV